MAGSTYGRHYRITTWGESHGPALGCVIDGCPAGLALDAADIQPYLDRRKPGTSTVTTARREEDSVEILSGVFDGQTTGTPISLLIRNTSQRSGDYGNLASAYRPGHADYGYDQKYGIRDHRGGGRSSARETAGRVAAGAIACKILSSLGIQVHAYTTAIGPIALPTDFAATGATSTPAPQGASAPDAACAGLMGLSDAQLAASLSNPVCMPDAALAQQAVAYVEECRGRGDSVGGTVECRITGAPAGLGEPVFDKLDAALGHALFSIGAVKAVEVGDGIAATRRSGSENNDGMRMDGSRPGFMSNHAGGILGGLSTGAPIIARAHFKPTPSIYRPQPTITKDGQEAVLEIAGRHDPVVVPRAVVVVESMCAITLLDALLGNLGSRMAHLRSIYT